MRVIAVDKIINMMMNSGESFVFLYKRARPKCKNCGHLAKEYEGEICSECKGSIKKYRTAVGKFDSESKIEKGKKGKLLVYYDIEKNEHRRCYIENIVYAKIKEEMLFAENIKIE